MQHLRINPTPIEHRIRRIEELTVNSSAFIQANNLDSFSTFPKDLSNLTLAEFIGLCDHYGLTPTVSKFPTAWVQIGKCDIGIGVKDMIEVPEQNNDGLELLRAALKAHGLNETHDDDI